MGRWWDYAAGKNPLEALGEGAWQVNSEKVQAILTPTLPPTAFKMGEKADGPLQTHLMDVFTTSCNLAGICGLVVPCGFTSCQPRLPSGCGF